MRWSCWPERFRRSGENHDRAQLDARARPEAGGARCILEASMAGEFRAAVIGAVIALEQDDLVGLHVGDVKSAMHRAVLNRIDRSGQMRCLQIVFQVVPDLGRDEIVARGRARMAHGEWESLYWSDYRPP